MAPIENAGRSMGTFHRIKARDLTRDFIDIAPSKFTV